MDVDNKPTNSYNPLYTYHLPSLVFNYDSSCLCDKAKLLYCLIVSLSHRTGCCMVTDDYFVDIYGYSKRTVSRCVNQLRECGFIEIAYVNNNKRRRRIYPVNIEQAINDANNPLCYAAKTITSDIIARKDKFNEDNLSNKLYFVNKQTNTSKRNGQDNFRNGNGSYVIDGVSHKPNNALSFAKKFSEDTPNRVVTNATGGEHSINNNINKSIQIKVRALGASSSIQNEETPKPKPKPESLKEVEEYVEQLKDSGMSNVVTAKEFYDRYESAG